MTVEEQIAAIEEEISTTKYNKATQHHIGKLKAKLAALREKAEARRGGGARGLGFGVRKEGHATITFVGLPSVGKSTLLNKLTNAVSRVAAYEFTTLEVVPGMLDYESLKLQLLDVPGLILGAADGKGRGREVLSMVRNADLVLIVLDVNRIDVGERIKDELYGVGIRLDRPRPDVSIKKMDKGGIRITKTVRVRRLDDATIKSILASRNIHNADVVIREDISDDDFIDVVYDNRVYMPSIVVVNKIDEYPEAVFPGDYLPISADKDVNLDALKELIFERLRFMRIYLKPQGEPVDLDEPLILREGSNIRDLCESLHRDFLEKFRYANVWGKSVKHAGQRCGIGHVLKDKDIVSIVKEL
jgi:uncharacterized protein